MSKTTCRWCNNLSNKNLSFCYANGDSSANCNSPDIVDNPNAQGCTQCQFLNGCNGQGACQFNDTCNCNSAHQGSSCQCLTCPISNNQQCGGLNSTTLTQIGNCDCNGTCNCAFGYWGNACQCTTCQGYPNQCSGHGTCNCDGSCTCSGGWAGVVCDCSTTCKNGCSGHGTCVCGQCQCDVGYQLLDDCSCKDSCPSNCNNNGDCGCDGTCTCYGYTGDACQTQDPCSNSTCTACQKDPNCGWCSDYNVCENKYFPSQSRCLKAKKTFATTCPNSKLQTAVTSVTENQTTTIAVVVVAVLLLLLAIVALVIYMRKKKETNDFLLTGMMTTDNIGNNPLFKDKEVGGDNPFYAHPDNNQDISRANVHDK